MSDQLGIFGIDLGTTYSAIAYVDESGRPVMASNIQEGSDTTPSVVHFETASNTVVGQVAKESARLAPGEVVSLVKRHMGDPEWSRTFHGKSYAAPAVSAHILKALAQDAEVASGRRVDSVVITVPAYFGSLETAATRQAGEIAGLNVIGIVPEPVAAAIAYGMATEPGEKNLLLFDLGGGTFDVTIIALTETSIDTVAVEGDHQLGGADWDEALFEHLLERASEELEDPDLADDPEFVQDLWTKTEELKKKLSQVESRPVILSSGSGASTKIVVTRDEFEALTAHRMQQAIDKTRRALELAEAERPGITSELDEVLLVGGSTLMPQVARRLREEFGWEPKLMDPHLAVAKGAALYAAGALVRSLAENARESSGEEARPDVSPEEIEQIVEQVSQDTGIAADRLAGLVEKATTQNRLAMAIGVALVDTDVPGWESMAAPPKKVHHLVPAQAVLPYDAEALGEGFTASTVAEHQHSILIELYEQASPAPSPHLGSNRKLKDGEITDLSAFLLPKSSPIDIFVNVTNEGHVSVDAREPRSGHNVVVRAQIQPLDDAEVEAARTAMAAMTVSTQ